MACPCSDREACRQAYRHTGRETVTEHRPICVTVPIFVCMCILRLLICVTVPKNPIISMSTLRICVTIQKNQKNPILYSPEAPTPPIPPHPPPRVYRIGFIGFFGTVSQILNVGIEIIGFFGTVSQISSLGSQKAKNIGTVSQISYLLCTCASLAGKPLRTVTVVCRNACVRLVMVGCSVEHVL